MVTNTPKLLQACLDMYHHPAWISDQFGAIVAMNCLAEELQINDLDLDKVHIKVKNKKFRYSQKELNHGTNCFLNELEDEEQIDNRLIESVNRLGAALDKRDSKLLRI